MAGITGEPFVAAIQFECGPAIVIEVPQFPVSQAVAVLAFRPQFAPVDILALMAGVAVGRRLILIEAAGVTTLAGCCAVLAEEWVLGVAIMVEGDLFPGLLTMARVAFLAEV